MEVIDFELPDLAETTQPKLHGRKREKPARVVAPFNRKPLPNNRDAEDGVIGAAILSPDLIAEFADAGLIPEAFFAPENAEIWRAVEALHERRALIDEITIAEELKRAGKLKEVGGLAALNAITGRVESTYMAREHLNIVLENYGRRLLISDAFRTQEAAYSGQIDLDELIEARESAIKQIKERRLDAGFALRALEEFEIPPPGHESILLGTDRYLVRGDGCIIAAPSGVGKSVLELQMAMCWAVGRPFMGIPCNGPLKSLIVQAEDSDGDVAEMYQSIRVCMKLTPEEERLLKENIRIVSDNVNQGQQFLRVMAGYLRKFPADLVWINPLLAYAKCDIKDSEAIGGFLRSGLNGLNRKKKFAWIIVHHTNKPPTDKGGNERQWNEQMYEMAGGADIINWARAIIILKPRATEGYFHLILAKRGKRAGVTVQVGETGMQVEVVTKLGIRHATGRIQVEGADIPRIFWEYITPEEEEEIKANEPAKSRGSGRKPQYSPAEILRCFPEGEENAERMAVVAKRAGESVGISRAKCFEFRAEFLQSGQIQQTPIGKYYRPAPKV